jgi:mono/diheme cytochrome c family protein
MKRNANIFAVVASSTIMSHAAVASEATDEAKLKAGHDLALLVCSACHVVGPDQSYPPSLTNPAPAFADIANRPGTTAVSLQKFLSAMHGNLRSIPRQMPDPMLMDNQKAEVVTYIMSLRQKS